MHIQNANDGDSYFLPIFNIASFPNEDGRFVRNRTKRRSEQCTTIRIQHFSEIQHVLGILVIANKPCVGC